ncbi:MAG: competence/damage-inducible protein A [Lachnospiraceae bacterium]
MVVELISVGTEILMGNIVNTNAAYLASRCADLGLVCYYQTVVGDNPDRVKESVQMALSRADVLLMTGGLGPTQDDLTKHVVAETFGKSLYEDRGVIEDLKAFFLKRGLECTPNNFRQAMIPEGAKIVPNTNGTAPGIHIEENGKHVFLMPGPPNEMKPMFEQSIAPYLHSLSGEIICSKMIKVSGASESKAETDIMDLLEVQTNPTIAPYAKTGEVHFRVSAKAGDEKKAQALLNPVVDELIKRFGNAIYTTDEHVELEDVIIRRCIEKNYTLSCAESCTGGLLSATLINASGASAVIGRSFITYANEAKVQELGVSEDTLEKYGAVSEEVAIEMVKGTKRNAHSEVSVAITGIAGPTGGSDEKPVGLVYIACMLEDQIVTRKCQFSGNRMKIRENATKAAMNMIYRGIVG